MGLLDDAIREHLDLKRRRGADPAEVERAEREALGPVRRSPEEPPPPLEPVGAAPDEEYVAGWDEPADDGHPAHSDGDFEPFEEHEVEDEFDDAPHAGPAAPAPPSDVAPSAPQPVRFTDELAPAPAPPERDPSEPSTAEFFQAVPSAQEHLAAVPPPARGRPDDEERPGHENKTSEPVTSAPSDEDVLEETPEFLSDTPDHDRLWFEQKPPRDFDFDG